MLEGQGIWVDEVLAYEEVDFWWEVEEGEMAPVAVGSINSIAFILATRAFLCFEGICILGHCVKQSGL